MIDLTTSAAMLLVGLGAAGVSGVERPSPPTRIGMVCHEWDYHAHACVEEIEVMNDPANSAVFYVSKLAVDADGSPRAYHPGDIGSYDYLANIAASSLYGIQGKDAVGPAAGFYVSGTSLVDQHYPKKRDTRHWVNAELVPYYVSPTALPMPAGHSFPLGSLAFVVDLNTGGWSGAIYADEGRAVGEGSIALAKALGLNPFSKAHPPKVVGFDGKRFLYIVFPGVTAASPWVEAAIETLARKKFEEWGGETRLRALYPQCPALKRTER